jgi:hypothetical protein
VDKGVYSLTSRGDSSQRLNTCCADGRLLVRKHSANWQQEKACLLLERFAHPGGYPSHDIERERLDRLVCISNACLQNLSDLAWEI